MSRRIVFGSLVGILIASLAALGCSSGSRVSFALIEVRIDDKNFNPDTDDIKVDIGSIPVGSTQTYTIMVSNTGQDKDLAIQALVLDYTPQSAEEGPDPENMAFYLRNVPPIPALIAPTNEGTGEVPEFQTFQVVFKRFEDSIVRNTTLTIQNDSKDGDKQNFQIKFETKDCNPKISTPAQVDFGQVHEESCRDITISNTGNCGLLLNGFIFEGSAEYTLTAEGQEYPGDLSSDKVVIDPPLEIPANSSVTWQVCYTPITGDPTQADLFVFPSNDESALDGRRIEIIANTSGPCIKVTPAPVDFGGKLIGQPAKIDVEIKSCGTGPLEISDIFLQDGTDETFQSSLDFQIDYSKLPAGVKPTLEEPMIVGINDSVLFTVQCTPDQQNQVDPVTGEVLKDKGVIQINNNTFDVDLEIETICFGVLVECPQPTILIEEGEEVPPQTNLHLYGEYSTPSSGAITSYSWTVDQPEENKFNLVPTLVFPNPTHQVNVAGTYTYCLDVCDAQFCSSDAQCNTTACKKVVVVPDQAIHCELTWDTPGDLNQFDEGPDAGSDMDLHFTHPFATGPDLDGNGKPDGWFDLTYDCFWYNPNPEWESMNPNVSDDPSLDRDDTDGAGPENINLDVPVDGREYRIGVHYWDDHGFGASYPMIKCWIFGQLVFEKNLKELDVKMFKCDMWEVATIQWDSGQVTSVQDDTGGLKITHCYENPAFVQIGGDTCDCN